MQHKTPQESSFSFNFEPYEKELFERFDRLIKNVNGISKKGNQRYAFEVDFMYAWHEIKNSPPHLQGKLFEKANNVIASVINYLRNQEQVATRAEAQA